MTLSTMLDTLTSMLTYILPTVRSASNLGRPISKTRRNIKWGKRRWALWENIAKNQTSFPLFTNGTNLEIFLRGKLHQLPHTWKYSQVSFLTPLLCTNSIARWQNFQTKPVFKVAIINALKFSSNKFECLRDIIGINTPEEKVREAYTIQYPYQQDLKFKCFKMLWYRFLNSLL
jgi:hypothetical protein